MTLEEIVKTPIMITPEVAEAIAATA